MSAYSYEVVQQKNSGYRDAASLMKTIQTFVQTVDEMERTIMVPNVLRDVPATPVAASDGTITPPESITLNGSVLPLARPNDNTPDLYEFYKMLNAVRSEFSVDPNNPLYDNDQEATSSDEDSDSDADDVNDPSRQAARLLRLHLRGLYNTLNQLTQTAKGVTHRYNEEVGL